MDSSILDLDMSIVVNAHGCRQGVDNHRDEERQESEPIVDPQCIIDLILVNLTRSSISVEANQKY